MIAFFGLISILSFVSMSVWITLLNKIEENEKKKKSITYKVKKFFKPKEEIIKEPKYTKQQIIIFLVASILSLCISGTGAVIQGIASEEINKNEINNEIVIDKNITNETDEKLETTKNETTEEIVDSNIVEESTNSTTEEVVKENTTTTNNNGQQLIESKPTISTTNIPAYSGKPFIAINNNVPYFTDSDLTTTSYEKYSNLDSFGRCGVAVANIGKDIMPTTERGEIGSIKPTGWHTVKYDNVSGKYLYNRCHLIGYQLSGENANEKNLITGTRYLNVEGMLPFENMVDDYIEETNNHVLYRVTPVFEGNNLLASGVIIEAKSVEDNGAGILFNVYCYNVQPDITINYATGESKSGATTTTTSTVEQPKEEPTPQPDTTESVQDTNTNTYILNKNTKKFHYPSCGSASRISEKNKGTHTGSREELISQGYSPCGNCEP